MLKPQTVRTWSFIHKWSSLVCTVFLFLLCVTGLPLIFYEEIDHLTGRHAEPAAVPPDMPAAPVDKIVANALAAHPGAVVQFVSFDPHEPLVGVTTAPSIIAENNRNFDQFDARTGDLTPAPPFDEGVMWIIFKLHVDLFAGLPGMLFLGFMGFLFVVSLVSGVVLYAPFMRKLEFGTVRRGRGARIKWLDLHNLLGIVTFTWAFVVGFTGVINTLSTPIVALWQRGQLAEMVAPYAGQPAPIHLASLDAALAAARGAAPSMEPSFVAYPGTDFSSAHHYAVFMRGATPLTSRLLKPALIDAETGSLTDMRDMPWYATLLFISQPLHFGDYGGLPMKIVWALLDIVTIVVLASGLYLWLARRRAPAGSARPGNDARDAILGLPERHGGS